MDVSNTKTAPILLLLLLQAAVFISSLMQTTLAYDFYVGDKDGWVQNPCETFNDWAERQRFQIKDQLVFQYKKGEDSVLLVTNQSYETCNTTDPVEKLEDHGGGVSVFRFDQTGPFYFISGEAGHCKKGQKLVVVVMVDRNKHGTSECSPSSSPEGAGVGNPVQSPQQSQSSSASSSSAVELFFGAVAVTFGVSFMF